MKRKKRSVLNLHLYCNKSIDRKMQEFNNDLITELHYKRPNSIILCRDSINSSTAAEWDAESWELKAESWELRAESCWSDLFHSPFSIFHFLDEIPLKSCRSEVDTNPGCQFRTGTVSTVLVCKCILWILSTSLCSALFFATSMGDRIFGCLSIAKLTIIAYTTLLQRSSAVISHWRDDTTISRY